MDLLKENPKKLWNDHKEFHDPFIKSDSYSFPFGISSLEPNEDGKISGFCFAFDKMGKHKDGEWIIDHMKKPRLRNSRKGMKIFTLDDKWNQENLGSWSAHVLPWLNSRIGEQRSVNDQLEIVFTNFDPDFDIRSFIKNQWYFLYLSFALKYEKIGSPYSLINPKHNS